MNLDHYQTQELFLQNKNKIHKCNRPTTPRGNMIFNSHNAIFHWNFQKHSVKILHAIIDQECLGIP